MVFPRCATVVVTNSLIFCLRIRLYGFLAGTAMEIPVIPARVADLEKFMKEKPKLDLTKLILSPMPGVVRSVSVSVGQTIGEGLGKQAVITYR